MQKCWVICSWWGGARSWARLRSAGCWTRPWIASRQSAKRPSNKALYSSESGYWPLCQKYGEMSLSLYDAFVAVYGRDIRSWDGYPVLRDMRELSTLSAILRDGHADAAAGRELVSRLRSLRTGDDQRWTSF